MLLEAREIAAGRAVVAVEGDGVLEGLESTALVARGQPGEPEMIVDLGAVGHQPSGLLQLGKGAIRVTRLEGARPSLIEASAAQARAARRCQYGDQHGDQGQQGREAIESIGSQGTLHLGLR